MRRKDYTITDVPENIIDKMVEVCRQDKVKARREGNSIVMTCTWRQANKEAKKLLYRFRHRAS